MDVEHGGAEQLPLANPQQAVCTGDEEVVYLRSVGDRGSPDAAIQVVSRSLASGRERVLFRGPMLARNFNLARSPDGSKVAFVARQGENRRWVVVPVSGGEPVRVGESFGSEMEEFTPGLMWWPDGQSLLIARGVNVPSDNVDDPEFKLVRVPLDGSTPVELGRMHLPAFKRAYWGAMNFSLRPDGRQIVFERQAGLRAQEWAIDNLLGFIKSGKTAEVPAVRGGQ